MQIYSIDIRVTGHRDDSVSKTATRGSQKPVDCKTIYSKGVIRIRHGKLRLQQEVRQEAIQGNEHDRT